MPCSTPQAIAFRVERQSGNEGPVNSFGDISVHSPGVRESREFRAPGRQPGGRDRA